MLKSILGIVLYVLTIATFFVIIFLAVFGADKALGWNLIPDETVKLVISIAQPVFWVVIGGLIGRGANANKTDDPG